MNRDLFEGCFLFHGIPRDKSRVDQTAGRILLHPHRHFNVWLVREKSRHDNNYQQRKAYDAYTIPQQYRRHLPYNIPYLLTPKFYLFILFHTSINSNYSLPLSSPAPTGFLPVHNRHPF